MKLSLVVLNAGKSAGQMIPITLAQFVIGRDPQCNLRPGSALISKRHCAILVKTDGVYVRDFDSTNGTFLNDEPLTGEVVVNNNDILKVGPLEFRVAIEGSPVLAESKTPTPGASSPKKATPPAPTKGASNEDMAAFLLGLDDEETDPGIRGNSGVPDGSTVMDMPIALPPMETAAAAKPAVEEKKKSPHGDSAQSAAKAILDKFNKRSR